MKDGPELNVTISFSLNGNKNAIAYRCLKIHGETKTPKELFALVIPMLRGITNVPGLTLAPFEIKDVTIQVGDIKIHTLTDEEVHAEIHAIDS